MPCFATKGGIQRDLPACFRQQRDIILEARLSLLPKAGRGRGEKHLNGFEPITSAPKADTLPVKLKMQKVKLNFEIFTFLFNPYQSNLPLEARGRSYLSGYALG